ncbi:diguanylate cyclase (GGDEF)-like protein [Rhodobacteraceae bacterium MBR-64]
MAWSPMAPRIPTALARALDRIAEPLRRPEALAFLPALTLAAFWYGGEAALIIAALLFPALHGLARGIGGGERGAAAAQTKSPAIDGPTGLALYDGVVGALDAVIATGRQTGHSTACLVVRLDDAEHLADRYGRSAEAQILRRTGERLRGALRDSDVVGRIDGATFAVGLGPVHRIDLETLLQMSARLQEAVAAPVSVDAATLHVTASVGFCLASRAPEPNGGALLRAAEMAALEARRNGPGAIRAYTAEMQNAETVRHSLRAEIEVALDTGAIRAFYQPQISTDTGRISGMEALVRWVHPERGILTPADFLPILHDSGLSDRLGEAMLFNALTALRGWDKVGLEVPGVSVNYSPEELRNPRLAEKIRWELDRFDIAPPRLTVEVLENVVADTDNDVILHNIAALASLGCGIDLDDFGTGHASIGNIRRFAVSRVKIDRSFVTRVDSDRDQQRVIAAILAMSERLDLETLAEGVETPGEHAMLSQLGCGHVQGFVIARPMPFEETVVWAERHRAKLARTPRVGSHPR